MPPLANNAEAASSISRETGPFKTPWVPFTPIMGIVISLAMMVSLTGLTWIRLFVWLVIGMFIYFAYGRYHSRVQRGELLS